MKRLICLIHGHILDRNDFIFKYTDWVSIDYHTESFFYKCKRCNKYKPHLHSKDFKNAK